MEGRFAFVMLVAFGGGSIDHKDMGEHKALDVMGRRSTDGGKAMPTQKHERYNGAYNGIWTGSSLGYS